MSDLKGKRVLIVGAGSRSSDPDDPPSNGRATAIAAARAGAELVVSDRDRASAEKTAESVGGAEVLVVDATDPDACRAHIDAAADLMGGLDGLVLNVGIGAGHGLADTSTKQWDITFAVNVRSHFHCLQAGLPHMTGGSAVLISSIAAARPISGVPAYDASKAAQVGLMRHAAKEAAASRTRVNVVSPGLIDTPLGRVATAGRPDREQTAIPLGRPGTPWDIAEGVVWLLSDSSSYITGQVIGIDGGLSTL